MKLSKCRKIDQNQYSFTEKLSFLNHGAHRRFISRNAQQQFFVFGVTFLAVMIIYY